MSAASDGGRITSNGGVMQLARRAECRLGIVDQLVRMIPDVRDAVCGLDFPRTGTAMKRSGLSAVIAGTRERSIVAHSG